MRLLERTYLVLLAIVLFFAANARACALELAEEGDWQEILDSHLHEDVNRDRFEKAFRKMPSDTQESAKRLVTRVVLGEQLSRKHIVRIQEARGLRELRPLGGQSVHRVIVGFRQGEFYILGILKKGSGFQQKKKNLAKKWGA